MAICMQKRHYGGEEGVRRILPAEKGERLHGVDFSVFSYLIRNSVLYLPISCNN